MHRSQLVNRVEQREVLLLDVLERVHELFDGLYPSGLGDPLKGRLILLDLFFR